MHFPASPLKTSNIASVDIGKNSLSIVCTILYECPVDGLKQLSFCHRSFHAIRAAKHLDSMPNSCCCWDRVYGHPSTRNGLMEHVGCYVLP